MITLDGFKKDEGEIEGEIRLSTFNGSSPFYVSFYGGAKNDRNFSREIPKWQKKFDSISEARKYFEAQRGLPKITGTYAEHCEGV